MWITGYEDYTVEDKIRNGLNDMMVVEWTWVAQKPREVGEQLALLRDIGHSMEVALKQSSIWYKLRCGGGHKPNHSHDKENGGKGGEKGKSKGKKGGQQKGKTQSSKDWKDRDQHLKGIPNLLEERRKADKCQKCGKGNHKWFECYAKAPVVSRVAGFKRGRNEGGADKAPKKQKSTPIKAEEPAPAAASGRIIEIPDGIGEDFDVYAL